MQHYFNQRALRSMRHIDNPTDDSYLAAFNLHNEQPVQSSGITHARFKRDLRQLPTIPRMLRFELSDAVTPAIELKLQKQEQLINKTSTEKQKKNITTKKDREPRRSKRSTTKRVPADFKVLMIPFEEGDARVPDAHTAHLIKRGRAMDTQSKPISHEQDVTSPLGSNNSQSKAVRIRKTKRTKRSAAVQMVKFELADAKNSLPTSLQYTNKQHSSSSLLTSENQKLGHQNRLQVTPTRESRTADNLITSDETAAESKRLFFYQETPVSIQSKAKKSINSLPQGVQKVIAQLIRDGHEGKAHIKYIPSQKKDYEYFRTKSSAFSNVPAKSVEPVQIHIEPVPVVEQLRYVYNPNFEKAYPTYPTISQPIIVNEEIPAAPIAEEIHHTYSAESGVPRVETAQVIVSQPEIPKDNFQFRPSKPDPLRIDPVQSNLIYGRPIEHFKYNIQPEPTPSTTPLIKIEYHVPQAGINENYKQLPEFRELSTLIGKSPDDQIHGLTYLLAKEMQAKQHRQSKHLLIPLQDQPQENTAPIQFHPAESHIQHPLPGPSQLKGFAMRDHIALGTKPGRLIGMAKSKQYVPIVEQGNNDVKEILVTGSKAPTALPTPSSYIEFTPGHGLSNGYEGVHDDGILTNVETLVHHPKHKVSHGQLITSMPAQLKSEKNIDGLLYGHNHEKEVSYYLIQNNLAILCYKLNKLLHLHQGTI